MGMKEMHTDRRNTTFGQREEDSKITVERGKIKKNNNNNNAGHDCNNRKRGGRLWS